MADNVAEARDDLETAILLAMHARDRRRFAKRKEKQKGGWSREHVDTGIFCPKKAEFPRSMITFDAADSDRCFSPRMDDLVVDPIKAVGRGLEIAMLHDGGLKWTKIMPMPRPRGIVALTNQPHSWLAIHYRSIFEGRKEEYIRAPMAISGATVHRLQVMGFKGFDADKDRDEAATQLALALSIFEDANRAGAMLATVEEATRLTFPIGEEGYKDFLRLRDGYRDTPTGRKNPILHYCSKHLRRRGDKVFEVQGHDRGAEQLVIGPMKLSVERSPGYMQFAPEQTETGT